MKNRPVYMRPLPLQGKRRRLWLVHPHGTRNPFAIRIRTARAVARITHA